MRLHIHNLEGGGACFLFSAGLRVAPCPNLPSNLWAAEEAEITAEDFVSAYYQLEAIHIKCRTSL